MMITSRNGASADGIGALLGAGPSQQQHADEEQNHAEEQVGGPDASMEYRHVKESRESDSTCDEDDEADHGDEQTDRERPYTDEQRTEGPRGEGVDQLMGPAGQL